MEQCKVFTYPARDHLGQEGLLAVPHYKVFNLRKSQRYSIDSVRLKFCYHCYSNPILSSLHSEVQQHQVNLVGGTHAVAELKADELADHWPYLYLEIGVCCHNRRLGYFKGIIKGEPSLPTPLKCIWRDYQANSRFSSQVGVMHIPVNSSSKHVIALEFCT